MRYKERKMHGVAKHPHSALSGVWILLGVLSFICALSPSVCCGQTEVELARQVQSRLEAAGLDLAPSKRDGGDGAEYEYTIPLDGCYDLSKTGIQDLALLDGLPLRGLTLRNCGVRDLGPLKGMPLASLCIAGTRVVNLTHLRGMLLRSLDISMTPVSDLSPLAGMPLKELAIDGTEVSDLSPLRGLPIAVLTCSSSKVSDIGALTGMPLRVFSVELTPVSNIAAIAGAPLETLCIWQSGVNDLTPLKGMRLKTITFSADRILRGMEEVRRMKTIEQVNGIPSEEYWREYDSRVAAGQNPP